LPSQSPRGIGGIKFLGGRGSPNEILVHGKKKKRSFRLLGESRKGETRRDPWEANERPAAGKPREALKPKGPTILSKNRATVKRGDRVADQGTPKKKGEEKERKNQLKNKKNGELTGNRGGREGCGGDRTARRRNGKKPGTKGSTG